MAAKVAVALVLMTILAGCSPSARVLCWGSPIILDKDFETRLTRFEKEQIDANNTSGEQICGW